MRYDDNRNGRITCKDARRHGIAPVPAPPQPTMIERIVQIRTAGQMVTVMGDGDSDGVVCE